MEKRLKVVGYIEYPPAAELPALGSLVTVTIQGEVTADGNRRVKKAKGDVSLTQTHVVTGDPDSSHVDSVRPPSDENQATLGDGDDDEPDDEGDDDA